MTIVEASNKLFRWFSENDSIFLAKSSENMPKDDFLKFVTVSDNEDRDRECIKLSLKEFEKTGTVRSSETQQGFFWFLSKPFSSYDQNVTIDSNLAISIADFINNFCESVDNKEDYCDPLEIKCKDIRNILLIAIHINGINKK